MMDNVLHVSTSLPIVMSNDELALSILFGIFFLAMLFGAMFVVWSILSGKLSVVWKSYLLKNVPERLRATQWNVRRDAVRAINTCALNTPKHQNILSQEQAVEFLLIASKDPDWQVRLEALTGLRAIPDIHLVSHFLIALEDPDWQVRLEALAGLGEISDIHLIPYAIGALRDGHYQVRKRAQKTLTMLCSLVRSVVFGSKGVTIRKPQCTLCDFDVTHLNVAMSNLREITIFANTCDVQQLEAFTRYLSTYFEKRDLHMYARVYIYGNISRIPFSLLNPFAACGRVDVRIERIIFGTAPATAAVPLKTLKNPDLSSFALSLNNLKHVIIQTDTYDFRQVEYFLTYAVNYIGQKALKLRVEVHLYGDPQRLHPNLYNNFVTLCKRVVYMEEEPCPG